MALPINISELINGQTVEWERIEFREGWNPVRTLKTICAFANDFNNWSGGYIIIGIAENNSAPVLPPAGLRLNQIDSIQKDLQQLCRKIIPNYFPIVEPVDFKNKKILVIWCPGGSNRPYKAPDSLGKDHQYRPFIRKYSSTVLPTPEEERELFSMANQVPFDDQVNHRARISDMDLSAIKVFLNEIGSDLENQITDLPMEQIVRRMNIAEGADEYLIPKNVGILFFGKKPQQFFPSAQIEIVIFEDEIGTRYSEKIFSGGLHKQLVGALEFLRDQVLIEKVVKTESKAEADRFFNYPYDALEEALCNAVYHRGYDQDSAIEVRIYPSKIDMISFPGPLPPLDREMLKNNRFDVRKYRNRRIGEFLKDLHLTEGRATGIPTILKALKKNGSPAPVFETNEARSYFKCTFKIRPEFLKDEADTTQVPRKHHASTPQATPQVTPQATPQAAPQVTPQVENMLMACKGEMSRSELMRIMKLKDREYFRIEILMPALELELIEMILPDKPSSPKQKYRLTEKGRTLLETLG